MFFILRAEIRGHQWHRDFLPAVNRYAAKVTGKPAVSRDRTYGRVEGLISGIEGFTPEEEAGYIERALSGQTAHHWTWYNPETREIEPLEIAEKETPVA